MSDAEQTLTVVIPLRVKPRGGRKAMVTPDVLALEHRQDVTLIKVVARAFRWRRTLESGRFATINELAAVEKINSSYISRVMRLTLLAPEIVEAILDGRQPEGMTLPALMGCVPAMWAEQDVYRVRLSGGAANYTAVVKRLPCAQRPTVCPPPPAAASRARQAASAS